MNINIATRAIAILSVTSAATLLPGDVRSRMHGISRADAVALHASEDPSLGSLRAGRVVAPAPILEEERAQLVVAQQASASLESLRAGDGPSHNDLTWLLLGAAIIVLILFL